MRDTNTLVKEYLTHKTDYAFQISGDWGNGKTYNFRNVIIPNVKNTNCFHNNSKTYKPVYISLFGIKSIDDISNRIISEFYSQKIFRKYFRGLFWKRGLKISHSVLKIGIQGFLNFKNLGNASDYHFEVNKLGENFLELEELVLCFDDLERKDPNLNIEEFCGYINTLIDEGIKILLIHNANILLNDESFKVVQEKIIGISSEFIPNVEGILKSIISERYIAYTAYSKFLNDNLELLIKFSSSVKNNFRHVIYSLDNLHLVFSKISNEILDVKHPIAWHIETTLKDLAYEVLFFSAEYKSSELTYKDVDQYNHEQSLNSIFDAHIRRTRKDDIVEERKKTAYENLIIKYQIFENGYKFYRTIFLYVTGFQNLDIEKFIEEYTLIHKLNEGVIPPFYEVLFSLDYRNCFTLSETRYRENTLKVIDFAKQGLYSPTDYISIMHYSERFDNTLRLNLNDIESNLIVGLKISIANYISGIDLLHSQFEMSGRSSNMSQHLKNIYEAGLSEFENARIKAQKLDYLAVITNIVEKIDEFPSKMKKDENFKIKVSYHPIFSEVNVFQFAQVVFNANNETLQFLNDLFSKRYERQGELIEELPILAPLISILEKSILEYENPVSIKVYLINELIKKLKIANEK